MREREREGVRTMRERGSTYYEGEREGVRTMSEGGGSE